MKTNIIGLIASIAKATTAVFSYLLEMCKVKFDKKTRSQERIESAERKVDDACNKGTLADLLDATIDLGKEKRK